jgi:hypothetical protein
MPVIQDPYLNQFAQKQALEKQQGLARQQAGAAQALQQFNRQMAASGLPPQEFIARSGDVFPNILAGLGLSPNDASAMAQGVVDQRISMPQLGQLIQASGIEEGFQKEFGADGKGAYNAFKVGEDTPGDVERISGYDEYIGKAVADVVNSGLTGNELVQALSQILFNLSVTNPYAPQQADGQTMQEYEAKTGDVHEPVMVGSKEVIINKEAVEALGPEFFTRLNELFPNPDAQGLPEQVPVMADGDRSGHYHYLESLAASERANNAAIAANNAPSQKANNAATAANDARSLPDIARTGADPGQWDWIPADTLRTNPGAWRVNPHAETKTVGGRTFVLASPAQPEAQRPDTGIAPNAPMPLEHHAKESMIDAQRALDPNFEMGVSPRDQEPSDQAPTAGIGMVQKTQGPAPSPPPSPQPAPAPAPEPPPPDVIPDTPEEIVEVPDPEPPEMVDIYERRGVVPYVDKILSGMMKHSPTAAMMMGFPVMDFQQAIGAAEGAGVMTMEDIKRFADVAKIIQDIYKGPMTEERENMLANSLVANRDLTAKVAYGHLLENIQRLGFDKEKFMVDVNERDFTRAYDYTLTINERIQEQVAAGNIEAANDLIGDMRSLNAAWGSMGTPQIVFYRVQGRKKMYEEGSISQAEWNTLGRNEKKKYAPQVLAPFTASPQQTVDFSGQDPNAFVNQVESGVEE